MSKKILVVSDSHGNTSNLQKAIEVFGPRGEQLELLIHLGDIQGEPESIERLVDCPVEAVSGNCDFIPKLPGTKLLTIEGKKVLLTHGHRYGCKSGTEGLKELAKANGAELVLFGHTHIPHMDQYSVIRVMNPGSISRPRQEGHRPTYLVITIEEDARWEYSLVTM